MGQDGGDCRVRAILQARVKMSDKVQETVDAVSISSNERVVD